MICGSLRNCFVLVYNFNIIAGDVAHSLEDKFGSTFLNVGEELWKETLTLKMGSRLYQLEGLKPNMWYEVKISYPATMPSSFSLLLRRGDPSVEKMQNRKLLNTEKLIFKTDDLDLLNDQGKWYVLVTVEPAGVVAIPHVRERKDVIFNIGSDFPVHIV